MKKILIAAGGTGGHIYPGLAIADQLKEKLPDSHITFVGSYVGMEKDIIPKYGYPMTFIRARGFERELSLETLAAVKGIFDSIRDSKKLLGSEKPDLVIGTGGFTCGMLVKEAAKMGIPTLIHEQNAYPGRSNRMLAKVVDRIGISFNEARDYFPEDKVFFAGNPVRGVFKTIDRGEMRKALHLGEDKRMVLAVGGSQGAESINRAMVELVGKDTESDRVFYHLTGKEQYDAVCQDYAKAGIAIDGERLRVSPFSTEMQVLIGASDLVISRSGAMSIAELAASGTPSILIPYPMAAGDHQRVNAQAIVDLGGGIMIPDADLEGGRLMQVVEDLLADPVEMENMEAAVRAYGVVDADARIADEAMRLMV
ncbi:MAG: undecaprenyldiphospho-muramoylpentapeptide beta-N-acetylglucosaminyltransferase [Eubacterium aggregans]|uniref:undecaprenyldiphospho-muramoylpentapeptide beta-N-acetylglucosaminyltransferase n=1 Tax=Eubacterium aggregans TaxID=81409 RepID=UPI002B20AEDD|nr:undecaprenyldiphospho-muramoylpentapeptide beta-N-acetylglucosaminyltransferase [Eubacterium aggregans]MEA5072637.1 undecaprenyldiphospho-muramoylpentapeptide beta-N-acetylglucosaminyltransferase [Eubacterium aggregans]